MSDAIIQRIICGAIPILTIPITLKICKYRIFKKIQTGQVKDSAEINNGYECKVCGAHFELNKTDKYVLKVRPNAFLSPDKYDTYDCYDCPKCGCQIIVNERIEGLRNDEQKETDTD